MMLLVTFLGLLYSISRVWAIGLSWPGDGGIIAGQTIQISFDGGAAPYTLTVLGFNPKNADNVLQVFPGQQGPNVQWKVSVPDGYVRFNVTDSGGASIISYWQIVYPDPNIAVSSVSVASIASTASARSLQAYISGLSTSAQAAITGPASSQGGASSTATATPAPNPVSKNNLGPIVGGVIGGVAGLLMIAIFAFWWVRRSYPKYGPPNHSNGDDATTTAYGGWGPYADKESNMAQTANLYNPYQSHQSPTLVAPVPTSPIRIQHPQATPSQPEHGVYGGLPEIQGGYR
ncbi:hypothetical protein FRC08_012918 [Ceratobasidium sp. 394]|nr:hypothetical protein FRC08_012918 [Ceratobasidium sp. 394]